MIISRFRSSLDLCNDALLTVLGGHLPGQGRRMRSVIEGLLVAPGTLTHEG
jgi:hypothetical protein